MQIKDLHSKALKEVPFVGMMKPCVYFLVNTDGEILYIGKSMRIGQRIAEHVLSKNFEKLFILECKSDEKALQKEAELIFKIQPPRNQRIDLKRLGLVSKTEAQKRVKKAGKTWRRWFGAQIWIDQDVAVRFKAFEYFTEKGLKKLGI